MHQPDSPAVPPTAISDRSPGLDPGRAEVRPAAAPAATHGLGAYWWVTLGVIALDQATKAVVRAAIPLFGHVPVVDGFLDFVHVRNAGVAFGFLNDLDVGYQTLVTTLLALVALVGISYYARQIRPHERLARLGLSMILGGALGNLLDRIRVGYVTDFVDVYRGAWHFWAFNVADAAITIGAILVFVDLLVVSRHASDSV